MKRVFYLALALMATTALTGCGEHYTRRVTIHQSPANGQYASDGFGGFWNLKENYSVGTVLELELCEGGYASFDDDAVVGVTVIHESDSRVYEIEAVCSYMNGSTAEATDYDGNIWAFMVYMPGFSVDDEIILVMDNAGTETIIDDIVIDVR